MYYHCQILLDFCKTRVWQTMNTFQGRLSSTLRKTPSPLRFPSGFSYSYRSASTVSGGYSTKGQRQTQLRNPTPGSVVQSSSARGNLFQRKWDTSLVPQTRTHSTRLPTQQDPPSGSPSTHEPIIRPIFEPTTGTFQYIVTDPSSLASIIIDPVLDFDPATQTITTTSADALLALIAEKNYDVQYILETHAHADHLSAAAYLQKQLSRNGGTRPKIGIGKRIDRVQRLFGKRYGVAAQEYDVVFDKLFDDDEIFNVGDMHVSAIHLPGHTPDHLGYKIAGSLALWTRTTLACM
jgi:hypothetical protein